MAGYIGSKASVVSSGAERKKTFAITTSTTNLTGLSYTPTYVHVYHNGVRLVDSSDYTATDGTSITLTNSAISGDEVVVISYATFQQADHYNKTESDVRFINTAGDTLTGTLAGTAINLSGDLSAVNTTLTGYLRGPSSFTIDPATHADNTGTVVIAGNLTVNGTTTAVNSTTLDVADKNITLNKGSGDTSAAADGAGITIQDAVNASTDATILWSASSDRFNFSHPVSVTGDIIGSSSLQIFRSAAGAASVLLQRNGAAGPWSLAQGNTSTDYFEILEGSNSRLTIKNGGDIIFNDSAGNPGLVWDASVGSDGALLIGGHTTLRSGSVAGRNAPQLSLESTNFHNASFVANQNTTNGYHLIIGKTRGTAQNAVTIVQAGDEIGSLVFAAADGTDLRPKVATVSAHVSAGTTPGVNAVSGELRFGTVSQGQDPATRMVIDKDGKVGIDVLAPDDMLEVGGTITSRNPIVSNTSYPLFSARSSRSINDYGGVNKQYMKMHLTTPGSSTTGESSAHAYGDLRFAFTDASDATLDDLYTFRFNGNMGIGTVVPTDRLHIKRTSGNTLVKAEVASNSTVGFEIKKTGSTTSNWRIVDGQTVNGMLQIYDVTDSRLSMSFDGAGKTLIGNIHNAYSGATLSVAVQSLYCLEQLQPNVCGLLQLEM